VVALDLDYFYAQCEEVRDPSIKEKPVVICVYSGRTSISGAVSTCNYIARKLGVKSGIPIARAMNILSQHNEAVFLPIDLEYYQSISERIMELIRSRSDKFEQASVDEAFLETKYDNQFLAATNLARTLKEDILFLEHLTCSVGLGQNKLLAKMAVDSNKPNGFTILLPDMERPFLDPLPVGKLYGIGPKSEDKLKSIGVLKIGDLALADNKILSELFGKNLGPTLKDWANGVDNSPVIERSVEQFSRIVTLKDDADSFSFQPVLDPIADDLANKLQLSGLDCKSIGIIAITQALKIRSKAKSISIGTQSKDQISSSASELFRSLFEESSHSNFPLKLRRVGIKVSDLAPKTAPRGDSLENFFQ
jgi:DNA polymerase IV (archaeal DinB-like DNA polymerase)